ncbi:MAG TPA: TonB-dependent receptor [Ferruginibacter sp.]|nr:TonB-dependent receptor [Ferruginibacter sp.]
MGGGRGQMGGQNMNMGHFYGKVLDSVSNKPLEAASVQLIQNKFDSATKKRKDVVVGGMLTTKKGEFSIENLPIMATYKLKITAIGYKTIEKRVNFEMNMSAARSGDFSSMLSAVDKDLGNIKLEADAKQLENVTVSASKATLEMKIDRKVFNVEKNLNSVGGTAVDVMKNVPSVNVDIDGNVSLRNASPQIFVDGRPTTMTLDQIPADAIASVEIITNPSAKYDASGGGAGILNIILKKNRKAGYNGNLRAGIDMRGRPNLGGDVNMKQGKVNFFAAGQFGMRKSISNVKTDRVDYNADTTSYLKQRNKPINSGFFAFGRAGMDYFIDNRNTLSIGGNLVRGQFKTTDLINTYRDTVRPSGTISDRGERGSKSTGNFRNYGATLSFKHNFAKANKELTADFNYNYSKNDNVGDYTTQYFFSNNSPKTPQFIEQSKGGGTNRFITIQTDYADPITSSMKIEAGLRAAFRNFTSFNNNFVQTTPGQYLLIPGLSNDYKFNDELYAGYLTFSHQRKKLSYQLGLRAESSSYTGNLVSKNQKFKTEYPLSLFPSAFATYKLNDKEDMQLNYSRKINRPNFFQLIPFIDYSDSLNLSVGNPGLIPEFTNLLELSYSNQYKAGNSLLATVYFRNTNDLITRYQYKDANPNPARADSVIITTYANANRSYTFGLELTGKNKPAKWWDLTTNLNLFNSTIKAGNIPGTVSSSLFSWFAKINNNFKLPKNFSIQLSADYTAKTLVAPGGGGNRGMGMMFGGGSQPSAQGYIKPIFGADFSIRKEFLKNNAASITLQFSDIFRTRLYATHNESAFFVQDNERRRDPQFVRLNFNWRFGKIDVSLFKRKNLKGEMENMQNAQQGMGGN